MTQRTPPKAQIDNLSKSESDLNTEIPDKQGFVNISRHKRFRRRTTSSSGDDDEVMEDKNKVEQELFKDDIKKFFESWKSDQDERLTQMLTNQNTMITKLIADIAELKLQNSNIQRSNEEIEKSISFISKQYDDLKNEVVSLQKERYEQKLYTESLERKVQDIQFKSRSSTLEVRKEVGMPLREGEATEDLTAIVSNIGKNTGIAISTSEIRDVYRLPGKSSSTRPIIVEFVSVKSKQNLLSTVREYNKNTKSKDNKLNTEMAGVPGQRQPVYIADYLPPSSKKLFFLSREFAKKNGYKFCWSKNGNIFLRKEQGDNQIIITSEKCLTNLQSNM